MRLTHSQEDERIVEAQLGRRPRGRWEVARRCHLGIPMVIETHPRLEGGAPFPTLFWLTCPVLTRRAGSLESQGFMATLAERSAPDGAFRLRAEQARARYTARRDRHEAIDDAGSPPGGSPDRIKCLHAHVAHELADPPNPVGATVLSAVGWPDCLIPCVRPRASG